MKNLILMLLLIGLFSSYASADINDLRKLNEEREAAMTEEEKAERDARQLKEYFKAQYREEEQVMQAMKEAQEEVDAEFKKEDKSDDKVSFFQIDATTLYYLFSTIAQTLAGAFGILGVFAMYKLQSIKSSCKGIGDAIMQSHRRRDTHLSEIQFAYRLQNWELFKDSIDKYMAEDDGGRPKFISYYELDEKTISRYCGMLLRLNSNHNRIKKQIISALKLTVITIAFSLIALPFSTAVAQYQSLTTVLTATVIMLSIRCLIDYSSLVLNALGLSDKGKKKVKTK